MTTQTKITEIIFKGKGKRFDDFQWHYAYDFHGQPIYKNGVHLAYAAIDNHHALAMHNQLNKIK